jgi:hypothetical protein
MADQANRAGQESHAGQNSNVWMRPVLIRSLARVEAPAGLWNQLQAPPHPVTRKLVHHRLGWAAAAAIFVISGALGGHSYIRHAAQLAHGYPVAPSTGQIGAQSGAQSGVKFAMQVACQACHSGGEL